MLTVDGKAPQKQGLSSCILLRHSRTNIHSNVPFIVFRRVFCPIDKWIPLSFFSRNMCSCLSLILLWIVDWPNFLFLGSDYSWVKYFSRALVIEQMRALSPPRGSLNVLACLLHHAFDKLRTQLRSITFSLYCSLVISDLTHFVCIEAGGTLVWDLILHWYIHSLYLWKAV